MRPPRIIVDSHGLSAWIGTAGPMARAHRHDEVEINLGIDRDLDYRIGPDARILPVGRLAVFWAAIPHQLTRDPGRMAWACVPLSRWLTWQMDAGAIRQVLSGKILVDPVIEPDDAGRLATWAKALRHGGVERTAAGLELQARLLRLGARCAASPIPVAGPSGIGHVAAAAACIAQGFRGPLSGAAIAAAAGLHRTHLARVFAAAFGCGPATYLRRLRLAEAEALLLSGLPVREAATDAGFATLSRFYAAFRAAHGETPARWACRRR